MHKGELIDGTWTAIVDRGLFWDVQRILSGGKHQSSSPRGGSAVHEFTGTMKCDVCGSPISITHVRRSQYRCSVNGCVRISKDDVDEVVRGAILAYLSREDLYQEWGVSSEGSPEVEQIAGELAQLRAELEEAERTVPASIHEAKAFARLIEGLTASIAEKETRQRELTTPSALAGLIEPGADVAARWKAAPVSARRKVAEILLSPEFLGEVRITRSPVPNQRVPAVDRIVWNRSARQEAE